MLSGSRLFAGETITDTLAAILTRDADLGKLPARTPPRVRELIRRCLVRDARQRLHDAGDARIEIEEAMRELVSGVTSAGPTTAPPRTRLWIPAAAAAAALAAGLLIGRGLVRPAAAPRFHGPIRAVVPLPEGVQLSGWASPVIAISPDGRTLAFVGEKPPAARQLFIHDLSSGETRLVPASESAEGPFFSSDGESVGFATGASEIRLPDGPQLKRFSLKTGLTEPLSPLHDYFGGTWAKDGSIFLVDGESDGIFALRPGARRVESAVSKFRWGGKDARRRVDWPQELPGGRSLLVATNGQAAIVDLASRELHELGIETEFARYASSGHLLTLRADGTLMAVPFDAQAGKPRGAPSAVLSGVAISGNGAAVLALSETGTLAYATGFIAGSKRDLVRAVRILPDGTFQPIPVEPQQGFRIRASVDGERAVVVGPHGTLWVWDLERGIRRPMPGIVSAESSAIARDGRTVAFAGPTTNDGADYQMRIVPMDGGAPPRVLPSPDGDEVIPWAFTPDGKTLLGTHFGGGLKMYAWTVDGSAPPRIVPTSSPSADQPDLSPDGLLLAYGSSESGRWEVYVRELDGTAVAPVSSAGGWLPRWARDGSELYFLHKDDLMAARVVRRKGGEAPVVGPAERIGALPEGADSYDVAAKRREFIALQRVPGTGAVKEIHLVVGFLDELERLTAR
jgi:serine/threonine-protein kinase